MRSLSRPRGRSLSRHGDALGLWLWWRAGVALVALAGGLALAADAGDRPGPVQQWNRWDVDLLRKIAQFGYDGYPADYPDRGVEAFFPGFPLVLRAVHVVVPSWTAAGLLVSLVAGAVACAALARLGGGSRPVLLLLASPSAVFLAAGYSEALWLALAVPAWLAARDGRWAAAGLLCAGACGVRVNGAFLLAGLVVLCLLQPRGRWVRSLPWLGLPVLVLLGYAAFLRVTTGDWLRWAHAQEEGWGRRLTPPWEALATTFDMATASSGAYAYVAWLEIAAVLAGVVVTGVLLARRAWPEAVYVGLTVGSLATSTFYLSVARSTLLWFPAWLLLAQACARWPGLQRAYLALSAPLMVLGVLLFTTGRWAG